MEKVREIGTILLSAYLLFLMVMPCSDEHQSPQNKSYTSQSATDKHDAEVCTPFCICSSCIVAFVLQPPFELHIPLPQSIYANIVPTFYQSVESSFYGTIWQPPKIA